MPVERHPVSVSQFCELLAIEPKRLRGVELDRRASTVMLVLEPEDDGIQRQRTTAPADTARVS